MREADSLTLCCSVPVHANENLLTCQSLLTKDNPLTVCSTSCYPSSTLSSSLPFFKSSASNFPPCLSLSLWSLPPPLSLSASVYLSVPLSCFILCPLSLAANGHRHPNLCISIVRCEYYCLLLILYCKYYISRKQICTYGF